MAVADEGRLEEVGRGVMVNQLIKIAFYLCNFFVHCLFSHAQKVHSNYT